jgi:hypothetical protein
MTVISKDQDWLAIEHPRSFALALEDFQDRTRKRREEHCVVQSSPGDIESGFCQLDSRLNNFAVFCPHCVLQLGELGLRLTQLLFLSMQLTFGFVALVLGGGVFLNKLANSTIVFLRESQVFAKHVQSPTGSFDFVGMRTGE